MAYSFHEIDINEHPELFLLWLLEYCRNVLKADNNTLTGKVDCLLQPVRREEESKIAQSFESSDPRTLLTVSEQTPAGVGNCFTNIAICKKLTTFTSDELSSYVAAPTNNDDTEDALATDRMKQALNVLKIHVFGRDHARRNAVVKLQMQMRNLKVTVEGGI